MACLSIYSSLIVRGATGAFEAILRNHGMETVKMTGKATPDPARIADAIERPEMGSVWVMP